MLVQRVVRKSVLANLCCPYRHARRTFADGPNGDGRQRVPLPRTYDARFVESRGWYDWWLSEGYFKWTYKDRRNRDVTQKYTVMLPPPNVTGSLHLGHALTIAIEDALVRYHRARGREVTFIPGLDHAGIATQVQVEKNIWAQEQRTRHDLGREEFLRRANEWKDQKADIIQSQIRRMGASVDWDRLTFTMDPHIQNGVTEAFVRLFDAGKIHRQERLVNWCSQLKSTISDIEVEHRHFLEPESIRIPGEKSPVEVGYLDYFAYCVEGGEEEIVVATTRLETMLGDTAIAVHPDDRRHSHLVGRFARHPFVSRSLPIIADDSVDPKLGTGAVKITPAHDFRDFVLGSKYNLPIERVIDDSGRIISGISKLNGLSRFSARREIQRLLEERSLWRGREAHSTSIPFCSRSGDIVEPQLKSQWFLDCSDYAVQAAKAVESGSLQLIPDRFNKQWDMWMKNTQEWCLSRQLWWGQQIPAYKVTIDGQELWTAARNSAEAAEKLGSKIGVPPDQLQVTQDEDVLDTWFTSSALPFLVSGWPDEKEMAENYPLDLMETGHDILLFWVARMVFLGLALTDKLPFNKVLLHGLICDKNGKKMSKSFGNAIDPMEIICDLSKDAKKQVEIGADALRFALCRYETQQHFLNVNLKDIEEANRFCNKIWQAYRFCAEIWDEDDAYADDPELIDQWIVARLNVLVEDVTAALEKMELNVAAERLYQFWHEEFCDIYLECVKPRRSLDGWDVEGCKVTFTTSLVFEHFLVMLNIFMPNLAEELYQRVPEMYYSICTAGWPDKAAHIFDWCSHDRKDLQEDMTLVIHVAARVRNLRAQYGLSKEKVPLFVMQNSLRKEHLEETNMAFLEVGDQPSETLANYLAVISRSTSCTFLDPADPVPEGCAEELLENGTRIFVQLKDAIDVEMELDRYGKQIAKLKVKAVECEELKLKNRFQKGSDEYRASVEEKLTTLQKRIDDLSAICDRIRQL